MSRLRWTGWSLPLFLTLIWPQIRALYCRTSWYMVVWWKETGLYESPHLSMCAVFAYDVMALCLYLQSFLLIYVLLSYPFKLKTINLLLYFVDRVYTRMTSLNSLSIRIKQEKTWSFQLSDLRKMQISGMSIVFSIGLKLVQRNLMVKYKNGIYR